MKRLCAAALAALSAAGCASLAPAPSAHLSSEVQALRDCAEWYRELDGRVDAAGVRDAQDGRLAGFPYLRVNRLLSSYRAEAAADQRVLGALVERMQELDIEARRREVANLPADGAESRGRPGERMVLQRASGCAAVLREADLADPLARAAMLGRAVVADDYSSASRVLGLYEVSRLPFGEGVRRHQDEVRALFLRELSVSPGAALVRYAPPAAAALPRAAAAAMLARGAGNPLGIPDLGEGELEQLYAAYAPTFEIEVSGDFDRFGALRWLRGSPAPAVNPAEQIVYRQAAWTRYGGRALLQLVYTIWFSERPPESGGDILAGKLDGVTWRVTLAPDGEPLLYDTMHPCGCYHMFFPTPRAEARPAPEGAIEFMFSPQSLPRIAEGERPLVRIAARTHYVERVSTVRGADGPVRYEFRHYDELRSLPRPQGGRSSVFGPDGLIAGSERPERFLFWPMGIPSAGAMRQWGRHSTAFVGRRHFDDADLLEKRFTLRGR